MGDPGKLDLNELAQKSFKQGKYSDYVHFVHIYVIEPHPMSPDISPYRGEVWEQQYSSKPQPKTYPERVANAADMLPNLQGDQLMLVDDLTPGQRINPLWCTYGPCPNCAYLIGTDGMIKTVQTWANPNDLETAIDDLLQ